MTRVEFSPDHPTTLLVVHGSLQDTDIRSFITIWNIAQPSRPRYILSAPSAITATSFQFNKSSLIFAGCQDGHIAVWDLRYRY